MLDYTCLKDFENNYLEFLFRTFLKRQLAEMYSTHCFGRLLLIRLDGLGSEAAHDLKGVA